MSRWACCGAFGVLGREWAGGVTALTCNLDVALARVAADVAAILLTGRNLAETRNVLALLHVFICHLSSSFSAPFVIIESLISVLSYYCIQLSKLQLAPRNLKPFHMPTQISIEINRPRSTSRTSTHAARRTGTRTHRASQ
jgi:hypothetical protein